MASSTNAVESSSLQVSVSASGGGRELARSTSATSSQAPAIRRMIASGRSPARAAPVATRMRNAASSAKRTRADGSSAQRPSLALLFTWALRARARAEDAEAPARPRLQRLEAMDRPTGLLLGESEPLLLVRSVLLFLGERGIRRRRRSHRLLLR